MKKKLTISTEDYLKTIYELTEHGESASTNALAKKLEMLHNRTVLQTVV